MKDDNEDIHILGCWPREDKYVKVKLTKNYNKINMQYLSDIYAKWNSSWISSFYFIISLSHQNKKATFEQLAFSGNFWATFRVFEQLLRKFEQLFIHFGATCGQPYRQFGNKNVNSTP